MRNLIRNEQNLGKQLSYLTGDVSTREKVRRILNTEDRTGQY